MLVMYKKLLVLACIVLTFPILGSSLVINLTNNLIDLVSFSKVIGAEISYDPYRALILLKFNTNTIEFFENRFVGIINSNFILPSSLIRSNFNYYLSISQVDYIVSLLEIPCILSNYSTAKPKVQDSTYASTYTDTNKNELILVDKAKSSGVSSSPDNYQSKVILGGSSFVPIKFIIVDAGHGGKDPGAVHNGIMEKDLTLKYAIAIYNELLKKVPKDVKVYMSRDRDIYLSLEERANLANNLLKSTRGYGLFISVHMNASPVKSKKGMEVYFISDKAVDSESRETLAFENSFIDKRELQRVGELEKVIGKIRSVALMEESRILSEKVANQLRPLDQGLKIKGGPFYVIKYIPVPSVLLEVGYISNPESAKLLVNEAYQKRVAELVSNGVLDFISAYNRTQGFTFSGN